MKSRQATLRAVLSLAFLGVLAGNAKAAVYTFSFSNVDGAVSGTVSGTITLPDGDGTFAATSIVVTSAPAALGYTTPFDVFTVMGNTIVNSFTVVGGSIATSSTFGTQSSQNAFTLNFGILGSILTTVAGASTSSGVQDASDSTLIYGGGGSSVPDAGPGPALALLLGGLGLRQWRSSRRAPAAS